MDLERVQEYLGEYAKTLPKKMTLTKQMIAVLNYYRAAGHIEVSFVELDKALDLKHYENRNVNALLTTRLKKMGYRVFTKSGESYCRL